MGKRSFSVTTYTPTATADATSLANNTHGGVLQADTGETLQRQVISEIYLGGQAGASAPTIMIAAMNSTAATVIVVGTEGRDAFLDGQATVLATPAKVGRSATIVAQRSATLHVLQLSFNAFGGIVRWLAAPGEEIAIVGLAVDTGSFSLSAFTGGTPGAMSSHFIYETV